MSFPKYSTYKDSGIEWLGMLPSHWVVTRLANLFAEFAERGDGSLPILSVSIHNGVSDSEVDESERDRHVTRSDDLSKYKRVAPGDLVYNMMRAWQGAFGAVVVQGMVSPAYVVARPTGAMRTRYVEHVLRTPNAVEEMRRLSRGVADFRLRLYWAEFKSIIVPIPSAQEQDSIVAFLDGETAEIDALVEEQRCLIELLKEKRQAVISQAVTKGLEPSVPMKDSGVEWIGALPAHWSLLRVKDVARLESGHTPSKQVPEYWEDCDIPWVSLNDSKQLAASDYITETAFQINALGLANSSARMLPAGAVVFTRDATIGLAAITTRAMAVSQHLIAWCPGDNIDARYLLRVFNVMKQWLDAATFGATIKTIGMAEVKKLVTPVPPIVEQRAIAAFIEERKSEFDSLIDAAERATSLLIERRSALISAAVTGKIDVRGLVPQPESSAA